MTDEERRARNREYSKWYYRRNAKKIKLKAKIKREMRKQEAEKANYNKLYYILHKEERKKYAREYYLRKKEEKNEQRDDQITT